MNNNPCLNCSEYGTANCPLFNKEIPLGSCLKMKELAKNE